MELEEMPDCEFTKMNQQKAKYTTFNLQKAFGWKVDTIKEWMIRGFIVPAIRAKGIGTKNLFSRFDVYIAKLFVRLLKQGFSREEASGITKTIYAQLMLICTNGYTLDEELPEIAYIIAIKGEDNYDEDLGKEPSWLMNTSWFSSEEFDNVPLKQIVNNYRPEKCGEEKLDVDSILIVNFKKIIDEVDYCLDHKKSR